MSTTDISPDKQNVDRVFSGMTYQIDFYQRQYRWAAEHVVRLLDDVFHKFREHYALVGQTIDPSQETIARYPWYYLNTYVTNVIEGRVYVVDGQQRLTTLSLMLMKLRRLATERKSRLANWIDAKIAGHAGYEESFWMNHEGHRGTQKALYDGTPPADIDTTSGITAVNMVANYVTISDFLDRELATLHALETFVFYFLYRLVLVNLSVVQTDVPMVFEVINDRGARLRPYEILKGKLLGQIDKTELDLDDYNGLWEAKATKINAFKEDELDSFFRFYLKARFSPTRKDGQRFDGDYHRTMFGPDMERSLGLQHNPARVKEFLKGDFTYYADLYAKARAAYANDADEFRGLYYNFLLDLEAPFMLVMSACVRDDSDEAAKIESVASEIDRHVTLLHLQGAYDSNAFQESLFRISEAIRGKPPATYRALFDRELRDTLSARRQIENPEPFSYAAFKQTGANLLKVFKRYFLARIDEYLAKQLGPKQAYAEPRCAADKPGGIVSSRAVEARSTESGACAEVRLDC